MATDPNSLIPALLGVLQQSGNIGQDAIQNAQQNQSNRQALQLGAMRIAAIKQQQDQDAQYQRDVQGYYAHPTMDQLAMLAAKYPDKAQGLRQAYDVMDAAQKQSAQTQYGSIYNAATNNRPDLLKKVVTNIRDAEQKAGVDTSEADDLLSQLDTDPQGAMTSAKAFAQMHLAASGAKGFELNADNYTSTGDGAIYNKNTGEVVRQAPEKPMIRQITVTDPTTGEQRTEFVNINAGGGDPSSGGAGAYSGNAPRSVRNNNPGNLRASAFTKSLPGFQSVDKDGFAVFATPQAGANAQAALLKNYMSRGFNTVAKIINRWAPPSDGNDTSAYVRTVARQLGVDPNDTLSPSMVPQLQSAISRVEGGPNNPSNGTQNSPGGNGVVASYVTKPGSTTGDGVDTPGDTSLSGDAYLATVPKNLATQAKALADGRIPLPSSFSLSKPYWQRLLQIASQYDPSFDYTTAKTRYTTRKAFTSGKEAANITSFNTALHHIDVLAHAADDLSNSSIPLWNTISNATEKATGDPRVDKFNAAKQAVIDELERSFRGTSGTLEGIRGWEKTLNSSSSPAQIKGVLTQMADLLAGRIEALGEQYTQGMGRPVDGINLIDSKARATLRRFGSGYSDVRDVTAQNKAPSGFRILRVRPAQ